MSICSFTYRHAKHMLRIILSSVACLTVTHFSTLSHKRYGFRKTLLKVTCVLVFFWLSKTYFSFEEEFSKMLSKVYTSLQIKYPLLFSDLNETWIISIGFRKIYKWNLHENPYSENQIFYNPILELACCLYGREESYMQDFSCEHEEKRKFGRLKRKCKDNIKIDF